MTNLSIEVASNMEKQCTGYAGAVIYVSRGVSYRIEVLAGGKLRAATRNGTAAPIDQWPNSVVARLAKTAARYFPA